MVESITITITLNEQATSAANALANGSNADKQAVTNRWIGEGQKKLWISKNEKDCKKPYVFANGKVKCASGKTWPYVVKDNGQLKLTAGLLSWTYEWKYSNQHKCWLFTIVSGANQVGCVLTGINTGK